MSFRRDFLLLMTVAAAVASPAWGQTATKGAATPVAAQDAASIPDLSGVWWHPSLPNFEPLASGPRPVTNRVRRKDNGVSNYDQLVGDYTNPILKPWAAEVVKQKGDLSLAGILFPSPANQCWPEPVPFIYKNFGLQIFQQPDEVTLVYEQDHEFRKVRMNKSHPAQVKASWYGDSVGHYEGDTLVVDAVGIRTDHPFAMVDLFGTPYTDKLHVIERFRLIDYDEAKDGIERDAKENWRPGGAAAVLDRNYRGKYLQAYVTVEDEGAFTTPWSFTVTYGRGSEDWPETVCAENPHKYFVKDEEVPVANKPDF
jgi:hypothetical protein